MRETFLPFSLPDIGPDERASVLRALDSGWITTGPVTRQFEAEFAHAVGAKHAIAVNSCTAALHLALESVGVKRCSEVITTPYTFAATAEVIRYFGAKPVFVDVDPQTLMLVPALVEQAITATTRAIVPVHLAGLPAPMDELLAVARKNGVAVVEDAAHSFPSKYRGRMIGSLSDLTCFSFYATKTITTAEGGMICTDNSGHAETCRIMALHGISKDAWKRSSGEGSWHYEVVAPGYKYNLTDIASGLGLAQLRRAEQMRQRRMEIADAYTKAFSQMPELQVPSDLSEHQHAWHLYMLRLNLDRLRWDRAKFADELKRHNIGISVHFVPLHLHRYYRQRYGFKPDDFPVSYREYLRELSLPIYSKMSERDVSDVIDAVKNVTASARRAC